LLASSDTLSMKNSEWNNLRARLHHDWLQNRYMTFLKSWKACFDNVEACGQNSEDVLKQLLQWKTKRHAFVTFINSLEEALSPMQLLHEPPLNRMKEEDKNWLGEVIHSLYLARTGIKDKISELKEKMMEIDEIVDSVAESLIDRIESGYPRGESIISAFNQLSKEISKLPHEIQVV